jgi:hypothetical protein
MHQGKYQIKYWFEHGGGCLWPTNESTEQKFGQPINEKKLPLSKETIVELDRLEKTYRSYLDWDYPPNPSPWTEEQKLDFLIRAQKLYYVMQRELGPDFEITNHISSCV